MMLNYKPKKEKESDKQTDRRNFIKTAVVTGLGGILIGKKVLAEGLESLAGTSESKGIKKVTREYQSPKERKPNGCMPESEFKCEPPSICYPEENCLPHCHPNYEPCDMCEPFINKEKCGPDLLREDAKETCHIYCSPNICRPDMCEPNCQPCNPSQLPKG